MAEEYYPLNVETKNYAKTDNNGELFLKLRSPARDQAINRYRVKINDNHPIPYIRNSNIHFTLDVGSHVLKIIALNDHFKWLWKKDTFGKEMIYEFEVKKDHVVSLEYVGPFWIHSKGVIENNGYRKINSIRK